MSFLLFEDSPWMKASISIFFLSTSNVPSQSQLSELFGDKVYGYSVGQNYQLVVILE
jgi:hypothetical protein